MKKIIHKYMVAIIMSLIIGISILGYGYMDYKYKTNSDLQNLEAVVTPTNIPTLEPTNTPTSTPKPTNIPTLKPSLIPTRDPIIDTQLKYLEDKISENNNQIERLKVVKKAYIDASTQLVGHMELFNMNQVNISITEKQITTLESQNIELNRQKTELFLKE